MKNSDSKGRRINFSGRASSLEPADYILKGSSKFTLNQKGQTLSSRSSSVSSNISQMSFILKDNSSNSSILERIHSFNLKRSASEEEPLVENELSSKESYRDTPGKSVSSTRSGTSIF